MKELTHKQMSSRGGTNRWKGVPLKERRKEMARLAELKKQKAKK